MKDVYLLVWLRIRHVRTRLALLSHFAGTDISSEKGLDERIYQLYVAALLVGWAVLMFNALLAGVVSMLVNKPAVLIEALLKMLLLIPVVLLGFYGATSLKRTPLKFTHPAIAYVAASPLSLNALSGVGCAIRMLKAGVFGALLGFVAGVGFQSVMIDFCSATTFALLFALSCMLAIQSAWLYGIARLACAREHRSLFTLVLGATLVILIVFMAVVVFGINSDVFASLTHPLCAALVTLMVLCTVALGLISPHIDMTTAIRENALFASLSEITAFSPLDKATVQQWRHRKILQMRLARGIQVSKPFPEGPRALLMRSIRSLLRQRQEWPTFIWALCAPLMGLFALSGVGGLQAFLFWLFVMVVFKQGQQELGRVFYDDMRVRLVRYKLPFNTLTLLVCDSLVPFLLVSIVACAAVVLMPLPDISPLMAVCFIFLTTAVVTLSCGLDVLRVSRRNVRLFSELGPLAQVGIVFLCWLNHAVIGAMVASAALAVLLALTLYFGRESAR